MLSSTHVRPGTQKKLLVRPYEVCVDGSCSGAFENIAHAISSARLTTAFMAVIDRFTEQHS
jgi:hypothetical protein